KSIWVTNSLLEQLLLLQVDVWYKWTSGLIKLMKKSSTGLKVFFKLENWTFLGREGIRERPNLNSSLKQKSYQQ
uniref:Ovule protein n=1 Tax=Romanomermis culicivorax TaxID=13658 RepID=A0A915I0T3_ROMCU